MSAGPRESDRALAHRAVERLWSTRNDGRWSALIDALLIVLDPKKKTPTGANGRDYDYDAGGHWVKVGATCDVCAIPTEALLEASRSLRASRSQAAPTPAGDNVIALTPELVTRMRRKA